MAAESTYDYAIIRVVPRVERGEAINVGVIVSCPDRDFLDARVCLDDHRVQVLRLLDPHADVAAIRAHLDTFEKICRGGQDAGPLAEMAQRGRFHFLVSPRSTVIQVSPAHTGRTTDPALALQRLMATLVTAEADRRE